MATAAQQAYNRAYQRTLAARRTLVRLEAEAAVRKRRLEAETPPAEPPTPHRERLQVEMEAGAVFRPAPPVPLPSRLKMVERQLNVLHHTYDQLKAEQAHEPT